ncbi:uncharacterized protein LTR77_001678 [Saxophila tyrrhenica]|uniref:Serine aminopeptidase S33 domain-containing protein n=1 Tax=Saxophila tyrrhenica TaxID=1690608 RepID=A0AAV9PQJ3_9PEZI|nr:hypothetical protein LTR77_001678 [Saxophila tyrrhenica]
MRISNQLAAAFISAMVSQSTATPVSDTSMGSLIRNVGAQQCYYPPNAVCSEYMIPLKITSEDLVFNFIQWDNNFALEQFFAVASTRAAAGYPTVIGGSKNVTRDVEIAASFCTPKSPSGKEKEVILATHGIAAGREHWNSAYKPETYNFVRILCPSQFHGTSMLTPCNLQVQHAIDDGYSVFFYDRLGCGLSTKISGYDSQLSNQVVVLRELASLVRSGKYTGSVGVPAKLALMGFSFGSYIVQTTIAETPDITDSVVLTAIELDVAKGVNANGLVRSFMPLIASSLSEKRFGELDTGYLTWRDVWAMSLNYFHYPDFEIAAAQYTEDKKQAFSIGEFLTFPSGNLDSSSYTGSALTITAETDYIVCDGWCPGIYKDPAVDYFANASALVRHLVPNTSHNINFHKSAPETYKFILDFLRENL